MPLFPLYSNYGVPSPTCPEVPAYPPTQAATLQLSMEGLQVPQPWVSQDPESHGWPPTRRICPLCPAGNFHSDLILAAFHFFYSRRHFSGEMQPRERPRDRRI